MLKLPERRGTRPATPDDLQRVLATGWGELHPLVPAGGVLPNVAMVHAPRNAKEIDVVLQIVAASLRNARAAAEVPV